MGRMLPTVTVLGMVAETELGFICDRQRAGIDAAKISKLTEMRATGVKVARLSGSHQIFQD